MMKFLIPALFFCLTITTVFGLPARDLKDDAEYVPISRRQQTLPSFGVDESDVDETEPDFKDFKGVVDTGAGYPFLSPLPYNPFSFNSGFFDNFEDVFRRLRERVLNSWWSSIPQPGDADWDQSQGNSTSEVKVIDGHKVVVNDTVYTKKDDSGNAIFRVRILNIRPVDSSEEVDTNTKDGGDTVTSGPNTTKNDDNNNTSENSNSSDNKSENKNENNEDKNDKGSPEIIDKQTEDNEISGNIDSTEVKPSVTSI